MSVFRCSLILTLTLAVSSCTHWLIETETRIQVENGTNREICDLSLVSQKSGQTAVLVPDILRKGERSRIYEHELVGEFNFAIFSGDKQVNLGVHKLKGGTVLAQITEEEGRFVMQFK